MVETGNIDTLAYIYTTTHFSGLDHAPEYKIWRAWTSFNDQNPH
jgi:hypothetical protein